MTPNIHTSPKSQGFSVVELLVLLAIIAIIAGISGLALMKWLPQANLKRAARTIVSMSQHAKIEAIKRNQSIRMECDNATNSCRVQIVSNATTLRQFDLNSIQGSIRVSTPGSSTFSNTGRASADTITVRNNAGQELDIVISPSGSVSTR